jgi:beta-lactamase class A
MLRLRRVWGGRRFTTYLLGACAVLLVVSLVCNVALLRRGPEQTPATNRAARYPLLAKRIFAENPNDILIDFAPLRTAINQYANQIDAGHSIYFEYLFTGSSIRVDSSDDDGIVAASLVKLPIVMNLYRAVELGRLDLNQVVEIKAEWLDDGFGDLWKRGAGAKLTLGEAAKIALEQSDNTAVRVIQENVIPVLHDGEYALQVLDVEHKISEDLRTKIRAKDYASILKCLYLACFVNEDHSQQILKDLTQTPFSDRLAAGVPDSVRVAHKIGVYGDQADSDCGIIYVPDRHYLLCVMMGLPPSQANKHIATISKMAYDFVSDQER